MSIFPILGRTFSLILVFIVLASSCKWGKKIRVMSEWFKVSEAAWQTWMLNVHFLFLQSAPPFPEGPPSSPGSLFSWWTRAARTEASQYLSCPAGTFFWSTSGGAPAPCSWWPSGEPAAWAPGLSRRASPPRLAAPPAVARRQEVKQDRGYRQHWEANTTVRSKASLYLFEFSHGQPVHSPQLLLWQFWCIRSHFLCMKRTKKIQRFTHEQTGLSCSIFPTDRKDSDLIAVVAVFPLILKSLFPQHGCLLLLCLLGLLLLLFLHIISQLHKRKKRSSSFTTLILLFRKTASSLWFVVTLNASKILLKKM